MSSSGSTLSFYLMAGVTLFGYLFAPAVLTIFFAKRSWRVLAHPWGYLVVGLFVLYGLDVLLAYLAFPIGIGIHGVRPGTPPPGFLERYALELRIFSSLAILIVCSITFLRFLRSAWSR